MGQKELLSALRKMTIIIRPVYNHQKSPVRDTRNVTKTLFLVWESQKRVKCMSFTCGGKDGCRWHVESKSHLDFEMLKMTQKPLSSFCETAEHDRTWQNMSSDKSRGHDVPTDNNIESIVIKCRPFLKVFQCFLIPKWPPLRKMFWS